MQVRRNLPHPHVAVEAKLFLLCRRTNKTSSQTRSRKGPGRAPQKAVSQTLPRNETRAQARESSVSVKASVIETREARGEATLCTVALGCREESSAYPKAPSLRWFRESRPRAYALCPKKRNFSRRNTSRSNLAGN